MSFTRGHRPSQSSISSLAYPLNPSLLFQLQGSLLWAGIRDASQYSKTIANIRADPHIAASLTKCTLLQLFILVCVLGVDYLILPAWTRGADAPGTGIGRNRVSPETAKFYFQLFWLYPLIGLSFLLSGSFFSNLAVRAHSDIPTKGTRSSGPGFKNNTSLLSRTLIIGVYLLTSAILSRIPLIGKTLSFLYMSLISSYYCFEYRFLSQSLISLRSRVEYLESRWVYFLGFGISPTLLSSSLFSSATLNLAIWSLVFPLYLLMAASSDPLPFDPLKPAKSHDLPGHEEDANNRGTTRFARVHLNPEARLPDWWPVRLPVLYMAVYLDDLVSGFMGSFMRSSSSGGGMKKSAEGPSPTAGYAGYGANDAYAARRDAYSNNIRQSATGVGGGAHNPNAHLQSGFGHVTSAPGLHSQSSNGGFARQADTYFGSSGAGAGKSQYGSGPPPLRRNASSSAGSGAAPGYGVGKAAGVSLRSAAEAAGESSGGVQSRRRVGGASQ